MQTYRGRWQITVIGKDSAWDQRISITGASSGGGIIAGVMGSTQIVDGTLWNLTIEHNDGTHGWQENAAVLPDPLQENGAHLSQVIRSKDVFTPSDTDPNDLVIRVNKIGPMFNVTVRPFAIDGQSLLMFADGVFLGINGMQYMGVEIENTWGEAFEDELLFDISNIGRATLASFGIMVVDTWTAAELTATQQTVQGRAIRIPPLQIGEKTTVYFLVDASGARRGKPPVEFVLHNLGGDPDPDNAMRHNARTIFIAELDYDPNTGTSVVYIPEGKVSLTLKSLAVDSVALQQLCKNVLKPGSGSKGSRVGDDITRLVRGMRGGNCDQKILRELIALLCGCLVGPDCGGGGGGGGSGGGGGWQRVCLPGGIWLPLAFDYSVEIKDGFLGQHGPLAFQDPWWKIVLLIIALIAWLVGLIESIVADKTGWGNVGDHPRKIGTVGASNRVTTDAALIELDNSRPFVQQTVDAITGEPNSSFITGLDTLISIDPTVAAPFMGMHVYKSGSRTGLTHGIITNPSAPAGECRGPQNAAGTGCTGTDPNHPDLFLIGQIIIASDPAFGEEQFSDHGDSGSVVFSREPATMNQVVGLLYGGGDTSTNVSPIQDVLTALSLKLRP